jgi:hypothetical protein
MSDYLDLLERELRAAVTREIAHPRRRWPRLSGSAVLTTLGVATSIAVAVLALALLSHKTTPARRVGRPTAPQLHRRSEPRQHAEARQLVAADKRFVRSPRSYVTADVIGRDRTVWYRTVVIDRGAASGVRVGDVVLGDGALVGKIVEVDRDASVVSLITDPRFAIAAELDPSGPNGVLAPDGGDPSVLKLEDLPPRTSITRGQAVVTSGFHDPTDPKIKSLYPPGIPIGRISSASQAEPSEHAQVDVAPDIDLRHLTAVFIITGGTCRTRGACSGP